MWSFISDNIFDELEVSINDNNNFDREISIGVVDILSINKKIVTEKRKHS